MNYYELFELPIAPVVDKSTLSKKYIHLQRENHPDYHSNSNELEQIDAMEKSAIINKAYKTFNDEQATIAYFLDLKGFMESNEKYELPSDFLMEMMEMNEEMLNIGKEEGLQHVKNYETGLFQSVKEILTNKAMDFTTDQIELLKAYYFKKKYLMRILDRLAD